MGQTMRGPMRVSGALGSDHGVPDARVGRAWARPWGPIASRVGRRVGRYALRGRPRWQRLLGSLRQRGGASVVREDFVDSTRADAALEPAREAIGVGLGDQHRPLVLGEHEPLALCQVHDGANEAGLRARIVFVQCAEGSTGDGQPYKGKPLDQKYAISDEVWNDFRLEAWKRYRDAVPGIPILVNSDANGGLETQWLLENMDVIALTQRLSR